MDAVHDQYCRLKIVPIVCVQCALYESRLSDKLTLHVDLSPNLIAASLTTLLPYCSGDVHIARRDLTMFNTTVDLQQTVTGPA